MKAWITKFLDNYSCKYFKINLNAKKCLNKKNLKRRVLLLLNGFKIKKYQWLMDL